MSDRKTPEEIALKLALLAFTNPLALVKAEIAAAIRAERERIDELEVVLHDIERTGDECDCEDGCGCARHCAMMASGVLVPSERDIGPCQDCGKPFWHQTIGDCCDCAQPPPRSER